MDVLLIKSNTFMPTDKLMQFHDNFVKQLESGVVVIPAYFDAEVINVPDGIEVIAESGSVVESGFMNKVFNV